MIPRVGSVPGKTYLCMLVLLVLARSLAFLCWPDIHFDADQAVTGLMAKHLIEGRALPVFQYAQDYVLVLESWLAAPLFAAVDNSVTVLKSVPVALNVATDALLFVTLTSGLHLSAPIAFVAALPLAVPGLLTARDLTDALGMNMEPLLFTLLLWRWREWPIALGVTAALGIGNREFALYAVAALLAVDLLRDRSPELWRGRLVALVACAVTWAGIGVLKQYSSPLGPGTSSAMRMDSRGNMAVASSAACIVPKLMPQDLRIMLTEQLPLQLGVGDSELEGARVYGERPQNLTWLWLPLVGVLGVGAARGVYRAWRQGPAPATWFGIFLILVGAQAVLAYALTRCGHVSIYTLRYTLLSLFLPVGAIVLSLERESRSGVRALVVAVIVTWIGSCALAHARLLRQYITEPPPEGYRMLAEYLDSQGTRFIVTDYWTGYHVAFLTGERIKALTDFERIHEYTLAVRANLDEAIEVRRIRDEPCDGAVVISSFYVCPSKVSNPLP